MSSIKALWEQFQDPGPQWRGKPFWSWNGTLQEEELLRQVHVIQEMGLGGFFMHARTGLVTEYLGDEWFRLTNACADEAARLGLEAWLYDEDRWPSGTAGGMVTENPAYRAQFLRLQPISGAEFRWTEDILAAFSCTLKEMACTRCVRMTRETPPAAYRKQTVLVFTLVAPETSGFYNGNTDVDRLKREATDAFLRLTHAQYQERCGDRFGHAIRGIFTDEPHRQHVMTGFGSTLPDRHWMTPWTDDLPGAFQAQFGYDLIERLPELFLQRNGQAVSQVKWHYMELLQSLFLENFARPVYDWCQTNGLLLTGHALHEDSLTAQTAMLGSLMRFYEFLDYPGVDVLTEGNRNYWIVKQLASAARQLGRKWLLSELYGCTGWQMNFESHKAVGDWQALFGINLRCHHLSWYTMEGEAKRDFPASILHQSAWWKDYRYVETYFARLGLVLSQGEPCCDVLVLNPVESVWCQIYPGWADSLDPCSPPVQALETAYRELFFWLAGAQLDFDYGDEEMIGRLGSVERDAEQNPVLRIGKARYRTVVVGGMTTLRSSTLALLAAFLAAGGKVIFAGEPPAYVDAQPSKAVATLAAHTIQIPWDREALRSACKPALRDCVEILDPATGRHLEEVFCQMRAEGEHRYLAALNVNPSQGFERAQFRVQGAYTVTEWDCRDGTRCAGAAVCRDGWTEFDTDFPPSGERVYVLTPNLESTLAPHPAYSETRRVVCSGPFAYTLHEPNVCVLDMARFRIAARGWQESMEVLKIDQTVRRAFGLPIRGGEMVQPWYRARFLPAPAIQGTVTLAFDFYAEPPPQMPLFLCLEQPDPFRIALNGQPIPIADVSDWWVDIAFKRIAVPIAYLQRGQNALTLEVDFHEAINIEAVYLIGDFGVRLEGTRKTLTTLPKTLEAGDLGAQGLPFYGGALTYKIPIPCKPAEGEHAFLLMPEFEAACLKVGSEGQPSRYIAWPPYQAEITKAAQHAAEIALELVLTRRNTFGPLHQVPLRTGAYGPGNFVTEVSAFCQDYVLYPGGLMQAPMICFALPKVRA